MGAPMEKPAIGDEHWRRWTSLSAQTVSDVSEVVKRPEFGGFDPYYDKLIRYALAIKRYAERARTDTFNHESFATASVILSKFQAYLFDFFVLEESTTDKVQIENIADHKAEHRRVLKEVKGIIDDFRGGRLAALEHLRVNILELVINHINGWDVRQYTVKSLRQHLDRCANWDEIKLCARHAGLPFIDNHVKDITCRIMDVRNKIRERQALAGKGEATVGTETEDLVATMMMYVSDEENFLQQNNNTRHYEEQIEQHAGMMETLGRLDEFVKNKREEEALAMVNELMEGWMRHVNKIDFETHQLENWAKVFFEYTDTAEDLKLFMKQTRYELLNDYHNQIVKLVLEFPLFKKDDIPEHQRPGLIDRFGKELSRLAQSLFREEELLIKSQSRGDNEIKNHIDEHKFIIKTIESLRDGGVKGGLRFSVKLKIRLLSIWTQHINDWNYVYFQ